VEGDGWRGHILVSEGRNGVGWRTFALELRLVVNFFQSFLAAHLLLGVGKSVLTLISPVERGRGCL
jgi:hypothetical protein